MSMTSLFIASSRRTQFIALLAVTIAVPLWLPFTFFFDLFEGIVDGIQSALFKSWDVLEAIYGCWGIVLRGRR